MAEAKGVAERTRQRIGLGAGIFFLAAPAFASLWVGQPPAKKPPAPDFVKSVRPALLKTCVPCHDSRSKVAGLDITAYPTEASAKAEAVLWRNIAQRIQKGEMPPPGSPPLTAAQKKAVLAWIDRNVPVAKATAPKPVLQPTLRRLTRYEYDRTVQDLFGYPFDSGFEVGMPDDKAVSGFNNVAASLNISPPLMEKYANAADKVLEEILADETGKLKPGKDVSKRQRAHDRLFGKGRQKYSGSRAEAEQFLTRFASEAFRRPATPDEVSALMGLYDRAVGAGRQGERALRPAMKAVLISPFFLFRVETGQAGNPARITEHEFATRLAYFLWSAPPDAELTTLAAQGKLTDPATVPAQVARMLNDPKASALTENFAAQWLQLGKLAEARPTTEFFPEFKAPLREAMHREVTAFVDYLRTENRPVYDLLDADYTFVNGTLARHYGIQGVTGNEMQKVSLAAETHRGGLLGMGAVLAMTSHTYRTSPTLRGKWVLDVIFGTPPPPPPPGVSQIEEEGKKGDAASFRELLSRHASQPACAACHRKIDPLGFALENYDAIGRWRTEQGGKPVDTSAQLPTGEKLNGADELRTLIANRREAFVNNVAGQMLAYALGVERDSLDSKTVAGVAGKLKAQEGRFVALVEAVATSDAFRVQRAPVK
ncbi:MAG: DUF1588 domain-containing protein [Armatimonadaceae bacterium]